MNILEKALTLFNGDIAPDTNTFTDTIWNPYHDKVTGSEKKALTAIKHYVKAYNGLINGSLNNNYCLLVDSKDTMLDYLPKQLSMQTMFKLHDKVFEQMRIDHNALIASRQPIIEESVEKTKDAIKNVLIFLDKNNLSFSFDANNNIMSIVDELTSEVHDIELDEIDIYA